MERSFSYILQPRPRIIAYGVAFGDLPYIPEGEPFEPALHEAETVAFPARLLRRVWSTVWTPLFPPVIFTGPGYGELTESDRNLIWRRWGVPVYEQRLAHNGEIVAAECDAHEHLHLLKTDLPGEHRRCPCGYVGLVLVQEPAPAVSAA